MTTAEAAAALNCTRQYVSRLALAGKLTRRLLPDRKWEYDAEVVEFLRTHRTPEGWPKGKPRKIA